MSDRLPTGPPVPTPNTGPPWDHSQVRRAPVRVTGAYLVFGLLGVGFMGLVPGGGGDSATGFWPAVGRGAVFVALSAPLVFWLARREFRSLARASALLAAVTESTSDVVCVKDRDGRYVLFNTSGCALIRKSAAEILGRDDTVLFDPARAAAIIARDRGIMAAGAPETQYEDLPTPAGVRTYLSIKAPYRDETGAVAGIVGIARDVTEWRRAELALRENESRLAEAQRIARTGSWVWEPATGLVWWSDTLYALLGRDRSTAEPGFEAFLAVLHPDDRPRARARVAAVLAGADGFADDLRVVRPDGTLVWIHSRGRAVRDAAGGLVRVEGTDQDVTEQVLTRDALRASERRFRELADAIPQVVWVAGADGAVTHFNAQTVEYTGYSCAELTGWDWDKIMYPDDLSRAVREWTEVVRTGVPRVMEFRLRRADGAYRWHICRQVPARGADGAIVQWYGTATDVEDLKRAEAALRDERTLLRTLIDAIPDLIAVKDTAGRYTVCNRALVAYTGARTEAELLGKTAFELFPADEARAYWEEDVRVLERGETVYEHERVVRPGAAWRAVSKVPLRDSTGAVVGLVAVDRNVQQWKEREHALAESQERLKHALTAARMGVWEWDLRTDAVHWSPECLTIYGVDKPGRSVEDFIALLHPDDRERVMTLARAALVNRTGFGAEFRIVRPDGTVRWIADLARGTYAADGRPVRMIGTVQDVTDRVTAEAALREERDRLARLAASVPGVLHCFRLGPDGRATFPYASPGIATIYGLRPEILAGDASPAFEMMPLEDRTRVDASIAESARTLGPWKETFRLRRPGGEVWVEALSVPVREPDGGTLWHGILSDVTARKRAEAVLQFQNALLTSQTEASPDGILVVGSSGRVLSHNHRFFRVWGIPEGAAAAGDDAPVLAEARNRSADPEAFSARVAAIYADPDIHSYDEVALADGRTLERYSSPIRGAGGEVLGRVWFFRDITDRKRDEVELERQRRELQLIFDAVPALIFYKDLDHRLMRVNQELERLTGLPRASIEGRTDAELGSPHADQYYRDEDEVVATGRPKRGILEPIVTATGIRWLRTDKFPLRDEGGRTVGVVGFALDVTDRMRAESEQRALVALVQHSKDFIGLADLDGRITFLNAGARRMVGLGEDEDVSGLDYTAYVPPEWQAFYRDTALRAVRESGLWEGEMQWRHVRTGQLIDVARTLFLIHDPTGGPGRLATVTRDITARKRAEQALRDRERLLGIVTGSARVGLAVVNDRYECLFANEAYADLGRADETDIVGRLVPELTASIWDRIRPHVDRALAGERVTFELARPVAPGAPGPRWFRAMYEPRGTDTGPTVVFVIMEITEQKRAEAAIRESEERYRRLVDVLPTAVFIHTRDEIVFCNPAFVRLMGASGPADLLGRNPYDVPHPDFREFVRTRVPVMLESGEETTEVEMRVVRLDGRSVPVLTAATPVTGSHPPSVLVALSDLTERERSTDLLRAVLASVNDSILTIDDRGTVQSVNPATERTFGYTEAELIGGTIQRLMPEPYSSGYDRYIAMKF